MLVIDLNTKNRAVSHRALNKLFGNKFLLFLAIIMMTHAVVSQSSKTRLTKNISKSFSMEENATVEVANKYGQIIVKTWEYDSVLVEVEITAFGKNDDLVEKVMDRVDFEFNNFGDLLTVETVLDRKSGFFKEVWNNIGDYSKTLLSKNKLNIDYEITIPKKAKLNLDNKFGNVYVNSLEGRSKISLAHGNFKANELLGSTKLYLSFGKGNIKRINDGFLELKGMELDVRRSGNLKVESSTSTLQFEDITSLKLNSRNDKIRIDKVKFIRGRAGFSNVIVDSMIDNANMELNYGEFIINKVSPNFANINLNGKSADINLSFDLDSYFGVELTGNNDEIFLSRNMSDLKKTIDKEDSDIITLIGKVGHLKGKESQVNINAQGGEVYLYMEDVGGIVGGKRD